MYILYLEIYLHFFYRSYVETNWETQAESLSKVFIPPVVFNKKSLTYRRQGYRDRYDIIDHGHEKKTLLCVFFIDLYSPR